MTIEATLVEMIAPICADIYPAVAPKDFSLPCVVYNRTDTLPINDFAGAAGAWIGMQIDTYATRYSDARAMADAIRPLMLAWSDETVAQASWTGEREDIDQTTGKDIYTVKSRYLLLVAIS